MEDKLETINTKTKKTEISQNSNNGIVLGLVIYTLLAIASIILGTTGLIKAEEALKTLKSNDLVTDGIDEEFTAFDEEEEEGIAEFVTITYNNGEDFVSIYDGGIDYYALGDGSNTISKVTEANTEAILNNIFSDNILQYLSEGEIQEDVTWSIEAENTDGKTYTAGGTGEAPRWFTDILNQLNLKEHGYQSKNL